MRDINEQQGKELQEYERTVQVLREQLHTARASLARQEEIVETAGKEAEARRAEAASAASALAEMEADNRALVRRLVEMKEQEVERMNDINRQRDELVWIQ